MVIYFGIIEDPLMGYIAQYNKCGLRFEGSEGIASERSENRHFRPLHSHLTSPLQRTLANIRIRLNYFARNYDPWTPDYIFAVDSMGLSSFKFYFI